MAGVDPNNPFQVIGYAATTEPRSVIVIPVNHPARPDVSTVIQAKVKRTNMPTRVGNKLYISTADEQPATIEVGRMLSIIPSDLARNLRGPEDQRHFVVMVVVDRATYDRAVSSIVVPQIVLPS